MSDKKPLNVVLAWHMHQPEYRNRATSEFLQPWTYLHGIKDYVDMAAHLENNPAAKAVVNFTPILLDQIDDYVNQLDQYLHHRQPIGDSLLQALAEEELHHNGSDARLWLVKNCLRINRDTMIMPYKPFNRLVQLAGRFKDHPELVIYASDQYFFDLVTWYHIAWLGETVRREDSTVEALIEKGIGYTHADRLTLVKIIRDLMASIVPRFKKLAEQGQVDLSTTPYAHPIMPLLLDINSTHDAMPDAPLPATGKYPDGLERARWHLEQGLQSFERHFGFRPQGCWPSEGSLSQETLPLLEEFGFRWAASGESVLHHSRAKALEHDGFKHKLENTCHHRVYQFGDSNIRCFFRDDGLSDLIGFTYSNWHADDAVGNMLSHLENIHQNCKTPRDCLVGIILDGENAWEHYPFNGLYFLDGLYKALIEHPSINLTTFSAWVSDERNQTISLPRLVAGSWVYGTFSTWIGDPDKNRAWELLTQAKQSYDQQCQAGIMSEEQIVAAQQQLAICEGSDWFWWFGEYNSAESVEQFDELYRMQLKQLYQLMNLQPPASLDEPISHGKGNPEKGGVMRHGKPAGS